VHSDSAERSIVRVPVTLNSDRPTRLYLRSQGQALATGDERQLSVRVFGWGWDDEAALVPIGNAAEWVEAAHDLELSAELASMKRALQRCAPLPDAPVRISRVRTRASNGEEAVRFSSYDPCMLAVT